MGGHVTLVWKLEGGREVQWVFVAPSATLQGVETLRPLNRHMIILVVIERDDL